VANSKEPYILLSIYQNMYQNKYGKMPSLNKYREKWAMQDVIDSVGYSRAKELIEYYFITGKNGHPLQFFFFNFDKIDIMEREIKKDKTNRRILQEATKKLVEGENE
jgi:hypothetical protein